MTVISTSPTSSETGSKSEGGGGVELITAILQSAQHAAKVLIVAGEWLAPTQKTKKSLRSNAPTKKTKTHLDQTGDRLDNGFPVPLERRLQVHQPRLRLAVEPEPPRGAGAEEPPQGCSRQAHVEFTKEKGVRKRVGRVGG